jgi:hypothetical protein
MTRWVIASPILGFVLAVGAGAPMAAASETAALAEASPIVVELFTSQGCSSCPPADRLLGELGRNPGLLVLSLPVDYWDYIGWKDTYASAANTARQRSYAQSLHHRSIYTPEMIIDGRYDVVGSDRTDVDGALDKARKLARDRVPVKIEPAADGLTVDIAGGRSERPATVWLVRYDPMHTVAIGAGENTGHRISYHNVVRTMRPIGKWSGKPISIPVKHRLLNSLPGDRTAVIVQYGETGPVIGAAHLAPKP